MVLYICLVYKMNKIYIMISMDKVSVIISTYNRFKYLLNTLESVKNQTYKNIEIIVVNDCSTEEDYYKYSWHDVKIIHLQENSKKKLKYPCAGYVRNVGIQNAEGVYIAFCDDDDIWLPKKIELQVQAMKQYNCNMSSTEGFIGNGIYNPILQYPKYNSEYYFKTLQTIYKNKKKNMLDNDFPNIWTKEFIEIHNCIICSSVIVTKDLLTKIGLMNCYRNGQEDYDCWLRLLDHTDCVYVNEPCFYYDNSHGNGQHY